MNKSILTAVTLMAVSTYAAAPVVESYHEDKGPSVNLNIAGETYGFMTLAMTGSKQDSYASPVISPHTYLTFTATASHGPMHAEAKTRMDFFSPKYGVDSVDPYPGLYTVESFGVTLKHDDLGAFSIGSMYGAREALYVPLPGVMPFTWSDNIYGTLDFPYDSNVWWSETNPKVMYVTPDIDGFAFAASYAPVVHPGLTTYRVLGFTKDQVSEYNQNIVELGGKYTTDMLAVQLNYLKILKPKSGQAKTQSLSLAATATVGDFALGYAFMNDDGFGAIKYKNFASVGYKVTDDINVVGSATMADKASVAQQKDPNMGNVVAMLNAEFGIVKGLDLNVGAWTTINHKSGYSKSEAAVGITYKFSHDVH
ncbi:MAG: porin [Pseudomonadota bacterium]|nr:porin [Pseudomonadota bacterium]